MLQQAHQRLHYLFFGDRTETVNGRNILARILAFLLVIILVDIWIRQAFPALDHHVFDNHYRLPDGQENLLLPFYTDFIKHQQKKKIVFIGSSPTYGVSIQKPENTYPYVYQQRLQQVGLNIPVYNVSAKGFLLSDQYYVLKDLIEQADFFFIQLNYHTFGDYILSSTRMRYPEMPERLGVVITLEEAAILGIRPTPQWALNYHFRDWLKQYWHFYREKDRLAAQIFKDTPEAWFFKKYQKSRGRATDQEESSHTPFIDLPPARQMVVLRRYNETIDFQIVTDNSEMIFLAKTIELLKKHQKPAIFFMNPINVEALDYYEMIDWNNYQSNLKKIMEPIEKSGFALIDYNLEKPINGEYFTDISHTLDKGGKQVGNMLFEDTQQIIRPLLK